MLFTAATSVRRTEWLTWSTTPNITIGRAVNITLYSRNGTCARTHARTHTQREREEREIAPQERQLDPPSSLLTDPTVPHEYSGSSGAMTSRRDCRARPKPNLVEEHLACDSTAESIGYLTEGG